MFGHFKYLAHLLSNRYQIKYTASSTMSEHAPSVFGIIIMLGRKIQKLAVRHAVPCRGSIE
jgi:hypothetical protein